MRTDLYVYLPQYGTLECFDLETYEPPLAYTKQEGGEWFAIPADTSIFNPLHDPAAVFFEDGYFYDFAREKKGLEPEQQITTKGFKPRIRVPMGRATLTE